VKSAVGFYQLRVLWIQAEGKALWAIVEPLAENAHVIGHHFASLEDLPPAFYVLLQTPAPLQVALDDGQDIQAGKGNLLTV
jgi:hypothetical protein